MGVSRYILQILDIYIFDATSFTLGSFFHEAKAFKDADKRFVLRKDRTHFIINGQFL